MSRETTSQDAEFARLLRSVMADVSAPVPPTDGWEAIRSRLRKVRRRRRLRSAARVGAGLLAVTAVIGAVNGVGVGPSTGHRPGPAAAEKDVRGSLRSDGAWLKALRRHVAESPDISSGNTPDGGLALSDWSPPSAGGVRVVFAGDLYGYRLALVTGVWSPVGRSSRPIRPVNLQRWFVGPAGAAAKDLLPGSSTPSAATSVAAQTVQPGSLPRSTAALKDAGVAVALVDREADVRLAGPAAYADDGSASLPLPARSIAAAEPGVYAAPIPADGAYRLVVDGSAPHASVFREVRDATEEERAAAPDGGGGTEMRVLTDVTDFARPVSGVEPVLPKVIAPSRGGPTPPRDVLRTAFGRAALNSGLRADDISYRLLSARPGYDAAGKVTEWTVATAVTAPSGAHFVLVSEVPAGDRTDGVPVFPDTDAGFDAWKLVPRSPLESLALAWPMRGINQNTVTPMGLIAILGPRGAVSAEVLGPKGQLVGTVPVTGQVQGVDFNHKPLSSVRFLDATGRTLVVTPVSAFAGGNVNAPAMSWPTSAG